jgi:hypothetical protein
MASNEAELGGVTWARAVALEESNMAGTAQDSTWHFYAKWIKNWLKYMMRDGSNQGDINLTRLRETRSSVAAERGVSPGADKSRLQLLVG